jgi:histidine ammonia-lyase
MDSPPLHSHEGFQTIVLDGNSLTSEDVVRIAYEHMRVEIAPAAYERVRRARQVVDMLAESEDAVYGVNTGFGAMKHVKIDHDKLAELQVNLIRSHCAGVGQPISVYRVRALLALRINVLLKGHSGVHPDTLQTLLQMLNLNVVSFVPEKGTVGASGDLAPLSHLALGAIGEGRVWDPELRQFLPSAQVLPKYGIAPAKLRAKEGLALINGTQFICALASEALVRAQRCIDTGDLVCALTIEALRGSPVAMDPRIHWARGQPGQIVSANRIRAALLAGNGPDGRMAPSGVCDSHANCGKVQDAYSLRCAPQVHGTVRDSLQFVRSVLDRELNAATDNPMVFVPSAEEEYSPEQLKMLKEFYGADEQFASGGNFHGQFPAHAADVLAIAIAELASISERRIERLINKDLSGLPPFLVPDAGLNSGFMIAHCTAAALVSENKTLVHPASSDSIPTSAGQEDHVSMGGFAARKALQVVDNVEHVLAVELLCACQGLDFLRPLRTSPALEAIYDVVRKQCGVAFYEKDRYLTDDIEKVAKAIREGLVFEAGVGEIARYAPDHL